MLLAQINRDSQGMTEFSGGGMEAQHVTLCLTEAVAVQGEHSVDMYIIDPLLLEGQTTV